MSVSNRLASEKSPYLLQHKDNPVAWQPWGAEAFALAKRENKPVFLSIGYSTCHWCHVMAHESFEDPAIAQLMNAGFINIKLDREERPDVDRLYMAFVQATTGSGGWPMSVWLTPEGKPFFGGTYFPPADRYGRAGFPNVLQQITRLWSADRARIESEGNRVMEALRDTTSYHADDPYSRDHEPLRHAFQNFSHSFDGTYGGFGNAPKFPRPSVFNFLLRHEADSRAREMTLQTLRQMAAGGMNDHLGGGFHRYSVDEFWHVPHFEKMLYDQGQLAASYVEAWQITHDPLYERIARLTIEYVLRDLRHPDGGFFSAEDADSFFEHGKPAHGEGAFYIWTAQEIRDALGEDARIFCLRFGVEENGNAPEGADPHGEFTGRNILIERQSIADIARLADISPEAVLSSLAGSCAKLLHLRGLRPRPHLDDKILTAWNGLMISALAKAGAAFREPRYITAAVAAVTFIRHNLLTSHGLMRTWRGEVGTINGFAEDYAFLIQGLLDLYEATFDDAHLQWALNLQARQNDLFWDESAGNYFSSAAGDPLVPLRLKEDYDGAEPAANSISARNLLRLARMLHDDSFEPIAHRIIAAAQVPLERAPTAIPQMLVALDLSLSPPAQAIVAGTPHSPDVAEWLARLHHDFHPRRVLRFAPEGNTDATLSGMKPVDDKAALYLCENFTCQAPQML